MDNNLITKKELLDTTGISYGSLYRWKRKNLIPNDWFIHRSTYTGHETFFPRDKIIERINKIQQLKENMSLDEIANSFEPPTHEIELSAADIEQAGIVPGSVINLYLARFSADSKYSFETLLPMYLFSILLSIGTIGQEDAFQAIELVAEYVSDLPNLRLVLIRKLGVCSSMLISESDFSAFDRDTTVLTEISLKQVGGELNRLLREKFKTDEPHENTQ